MHRAIGQNLRCCWITALKAGDELQGWNIERGVSVLLDTLHPFRMFSLFRREFSEEVYNF
jgi:hypothetical protein